MDGKIEMSLKDIYKNNDGLRRYVDKQAGNYRLTVDEVLSRALTREVAKLYMRKVRPILFNTEMVRAILDGRKTVTRRVVSPRYQGNECTFQVVTNKATGKRRIDTIDAEGFTCRAGINPPCNPGDILYVRETWNFQSCIECMNQLEDESCMLGKISTIHEDKDAESEGCYIYLADHLHSKRVLWRPSIHMPKEAARIWLMVTDVRLEKLQDMNLDDFLSEGVVIRPEAFNDPENAYMQAKIEFAKIWDSTIRKSQTDLNPWVWVIEFRRCPKPGHGQAEQADACDICGAIRQEGEEKENSRR